MSADALSLVLAPPEGRSLWVWAPLAALSVHATVIFLLPHRMSAAPEHVQKTTEVLDIEPTPPPSPVPEEVPRPELAPKEQAASPNVAPRVAAPAPAAAAAVLTQNDSPDAPADFSNTFVVGTAQTYAGGASAAEGTSKRYVDVAAATGTDRASPPLSAPPKIGVDRSRKVHLAEGGTWSCPFPSEADAEQIDHAVVTLRIEVNAQGQATRASVVSDPGHGFGREARACATVKRYEPALSSSGVAEAGTLLVNVRFDR